MNDRWVTILTVAAIVAFAGGFAALLYFAFEALK